MTKQSKVGNRFFLLAVAGFRSAASVYLFQQFFVMGTAKSVCDTVFYLLVAACTFVLSYALFMKTSSNQAADRDYPRA